MYPPQLLFALMPLTPLPVPRRGGARRGRHDRAPSRDPPVLGVRDIRCYAAALLWVPAMSGVLLSNISIPLAFALAVALALPRRGLATGRSRSGSSVSAKLLLWPMFVWTVATRRLRATALPPSSIGVVVTLVGVGGDRLRRAHGRTRICSSGLSEIQAERSYSIVGMARRSGSDEPSGARLTLIVGRGAPRPAASPSRVETTTCARSRAPSRRRSR